MSKRILIIGASGSGKTYISSVLRKKGINAVDADTILNLSGWYDGKGNKVDFPIDAGREFLDNHKFLWNKDILSTFLESHDEIYLFGLSGNIFDMIDLFDKIYFLKAPAETITKRLKHKSRENPMGKTDYQLRAVISYSKEIEERANELGIPMVDATKTPDEIFLQINQK